MHVWIGHSAIKEKQLEEGMLLFQILTSKFHGESSHANLFVKWRVGMRHKEKQEHVLGFGGRIKKVASEGEEMHVVEMGK